VTDGGLASLAALASIVVLNLVLSGDNAVVIGLAAHRLPPTQRRRAIAFGAAGAIGLRVIGTAIAALLLGVPLLKAAGGGALVWIAAKLLRQEEAAPVVAAGADLAAAVRTIVVADAIMSLDNVLAVGGAARGDPWLLLIGLGLSMPLIIVGGGLVAALLNRLPWIAFIGAAVLIHTGVDMALADPIVATFLPHPPWAAPFATIALIAGVMLLLRRPAASSRAQPGDQP
jgi:YjbE family integral membrane protein